MASVFMEFGAGQQVEFVEAVIFMRGLADGDAQLCIDLAVHRAHIQPPFPQVGAGQRVGQHTGIKLQRQHTVARQGAGHVQRGARLPGRRIQQDARIADVDGRDRAAPAAGCREAFEAAEAQAFRI